jgi:S1-C subfamily serine protease
MPHSRDRSAQPRRITSRTLGRAHAAVLFALALTIGAGVGSYLALQRDAATATAQPADQTDTATDGVEQDIDADRSPSPRGPLRPDELARTELFENAAMSVVNIDTRAVTTDRFGRRVTLGDGAGSGFVWDDQGHIVTNYHVIERFNQLFVSFIDGTVRRAVAVGAAPEYDIAVLKVQPDPDADANADASPLDPLPLGSSSDLRVGQSAYAIGNPFGLDLSLTAGIVSALGREIESRTGYEIRDVIQTDAAINPGNSGGPLLDSAGRVIGVNTAIRSPSGASAGIGFAVPIDTVARIVPDLVEFGRLQPPLIGIEAFDTRTTRRLGVRRGILIRELTPGLGADIVGLRPTRMDETGLELGDVILRVGDRTVSSLSDLLAALAEYDPGDDATLTVFRDGELMTIDVPLTERDTPGAEPAP